MTEYKVSHKHAVIFTPRNYLSEQHADQLARQLEGNVQNLSVCKEYTTFIQVEWWEFGEVRCEE